VSDRKLMRELVRSEKRANRFIIVLQKSPLQFVVLDLIRRLEAVTNVLEKVPGTSSKDGGETLIKWM